RTEAEMQFLGATRNANRPGLVAEVTLQLPVDGRRREGGELETPLEIEPFDGLEHADERDLHEVVERLAAVRVTAGEVGRERPVGLDELVTGAPIVGFAVLRELHA